MAVFLFFLSVALVTQNRMDISLALSVDHRLQAELAARAATNYALATMRERDDWEAELQNKTGEVGSGQWEVSVQPYADPTGSPFLFEVMGKGRSGPVTRVRRVVVEEIRMAQARGDGKYPHFFSYLASGELAVLTPDFRWQSLGEVPRQDSPLSAAGGPLFSFAPEGTATRPPVILTTLPFFDAESGDLINGPSIRLEVCPPGEHIVYLDLNNGVASWQDIPDPGPELGSWNGVMEDSDGTRILPLVTLYEEDDPDEEDLEKTPWHRLDLRLRGRAGEGNPQIETVETKSTQWKDSFEDFTADISTKPWSSAWDIAQTPSELTIEWDEITEPRIYLNWYSLDGKGLTTQGDKVYCHATHYFYGHLDLGGEMKELGTPLFESIVYQSPAILCYDLSDEKWTIVVDMMKMDDPNTTPDIFLGPEADKSALTATSEGEVHSFDRADATDVVRGKMRGFTRVGRATSPVQSLLAYNEEIYYFSQAGYWDQERRERMGLLSLNGDQIDPSDGLAFDHPEVLAKLPVPDQGLVDHTFSPRTLVSLSLQALGSDVTAWEGDLYCAAWIRRKTDEPSFEPAGFFGQLPELSHYLTILRYDGEHWQVWPGGLRQHLVHQPAGDLFQGVFPARDAEGESLVVKPTLLAAGAYEGDFAYSNRYAVLTVTESAGE